MRQKLQFMSSIHQTQYRESKESEMDSHFSQLISDRLVTWTTIPQTLVGRNEYVLIIPIILNPALYFLEISCEAGCTFISNRSLPYVPSCNIQFPFEVDPPSLWPYEQNACFVEPPVNWYLFGTVTPTEPSRYALTPQSTINYQQSSERTTTRSFCSSSIPNIVFIFLTLLMYFL
jgi:hypothetical protein